MTREEKLKSLLDTEEYDFIKYIPKENMWKLIFALAYIEDSIPMSDIISCDNKDTIKVIEKQEKIIDAIDFAIKATDSQDDYSMGMRNGMRYVKSLIDGKEPQYELRRTDEEKKLLINLGDEVINDYGSKGFVIGIDTYKGETMLSLLMKNHKVPQLVKASMYKTTGRYFPQIVEILDQIKEDK